MITTLSILALMFNLFILFLVALQLIDFIANKRYLEWEIGVLLLMVFYIVCAISNIILIFYFSISHLLGNA